MNEQMRETLEPNSDLTPVVKVSDMILKCQDCKNNFVFTAGNQVYFVDKGLATPKRCEACRLRRVTKIQRNGIEIKDTVTTT